MSKKLTSFIRRVEKETVRLMTKMPFSYNEIKDVILSRGCFFAETILRDSLQRKINPRILMEYQEKRILQRKVGIYD